LGRPSFHIFSNVIMSSRESSRGPRRRRRHDSGSRGRHGRRERSRKVNRRYGRTRSLSPRGGRHRTPSNKRRNSWQEHSSGSSNESYSTSPRRRSRRYSHSPRRRRRSRYRRQFDSISPSRRDRRFRNDVIELFREGDKIEFKYKGRRGRSRWVDAQIEEINEGRREGEFYYDIFVPKYKMEVYDVASKKLRFKKLDAAVEKDFNRRLLMDDMHRQKMRDFERQEICDCYPRYHGETLQKSMDVPYHHTREDFNMYHGRRGAFVDPISRRPAPTSFRYVPTVERGRKEDALPCGYCSWPQLLADFAHALTLEEDTNRKVMLDYTSARNKERNHKDLHDEKEQEYDRMTSRRANNVQENCRGGGNITSIQDLGDKQRQKYERTVSASIEEDF